MGRDYDQAYSWFCTVVNRMGHPLEVSRAQLRAGIFPQRPEPPVLDEPSAAAASGGSVTAPPVPEEPELDYEVPQPDLGVPEIGEEEVEVPCACVKFDPADII